MATHYKSSGIAQITFTSTKREKIFRNAPVLRQGQPRYNHRSSQHCDNPSCLGEPWCTAWGICEDYRQSRQQNTGSGLKEDEIDRLFVQLSQQLDSSPAHFEDATIGCSSRFATPKTDEEVYSRGPFASSTKEDKTGHCILCQSMGCMEDKQECTWICSAVTAGHGASNTGMLAHKVRPRNEEDRRY